MALVSGGRGGLLTCGCRKSPATAPSTPTAFEASSPAAANERHHGLFTGGVSRLIVSMTPDTIRVHDGDASLATFFAGLRDQPLGKSNQSIDLRRCNRVDGDPKGLMSTFSGERRLSSYSTRLNLTLVPRYAFALIVHTATPTASSWSSEPLEFPQRSSSREIGNVSPNFVKVRGRVPGCGVPVMIWGSQFTREWTAEGRWITARWN